MIKRTSCAVLVTGLCVWACVVAPCTSAESKASTKKNAEKALTPASLPVKIKFPGGRIALSSDGNIHDKDDIGATALALAMIKAAGLGDKLVHYDFSCHLGDNRPEMNAAMIESALGGADRFKLDKSKFFNDQTQMKEAIENFRKEGNKSSADNPLWYICAGPMEAPWRCVNAVDPDKRKFIHCISHAPWNEKHGDTPEMTHKWDDITALGVVIYKIENQNGSNGDADFNGSIDNWHWLRDSANPDWQWLYKRNVKGEGVFDVSDAGMTFWLITGGPNGGVETAGWAETKYLFENPVKK